MELEETKVLVAWLDPRPDREKGATYGCVSTVRNIKSAQNLIGKLTLHYYRFNWAYICSDDDMDTITTQLHTELIKGLK